MDIKLLLRNLDIAFFSCILSSIIIPVIVSILFINLNYQQSLIYFISQSVVVTILILIILVIQIIYLKPNQSSSMEKIINNPLICSRFMNYPFYSSMMIVVFNGAGVIMVSFIFHFFTRISLEQYIAIWLVAIVSSAIHSVIVYIVNHYHIDRYFTSFKDNEIVFNGKNTHPGTTNNIMGVDIIIISLPVILMLLSIYLYDLNRSNIYTRMGFFTIIGIVVTFMFFLLYSLKKRYLYFSENSDSYLLKISKCFIDRYNITGRELEIINMVVKGYSNIEICSNLDISQKTVKNHIYNIYQKTCVNNRVKLINLLQNHK